MQLYEPSQATDLILTQWYTELVNSGDLGRIFYDEMPLSAFFANMTAPGTQLGICLDESGHLYMAAWISPAMGASGIVGLWLDPKHRGSKGALEQLLLFFQAAFTGQYETMLVMTQDPKTSKLHAHFGFYPLNDGSPISGLWGPGKAAYAMVMTREDFYAKWGDKLTSEAA